MSIATRKFSSSTGETLTAAVEPVVGDEDEAVLALELGGDRLDQRIVLVGVLDLVADRLDELEELVGIHLVVAGEEDVGEDVLVALVKLVEVHAGLGRKGDGMDGQYRTRPGPGRPRIDRDR